MWDGGKRARNVFSKGFHITSLSNFLSICFPYKQMNQNVLFPFSTHSTHALLTFTATAQPHIHINLCSHELYYNNHNNQNVCMCITSHGQFSFSLKNFTVLLFININCLEALYEDKIIMKIGSIIFSLPTQSCKVCLWQKFTLIIFENLIFNGGDIKMRY